MEHISELYLRKFMRKVEQYNSSRQLPEYFKELIGDKKTVKIAELGAGPINTIGDSWPGVEVKVIPSDALALEYDELWEKYQVTPLIKVTYQDFEELRYPSNFFDIVHCRNALDHTENAYQAIKEMKRVCKPGGWVYLAHGLSQKKRFGKHHFWNIEELKLPEFNQKFENDLLIHTWRKNG